MITTKFTDSINHNSSMCFVCLKSYGDFIILRTSLLLHDAIFFKILIGDHLNDLNHALGLYPNSIVLSHQEGNVPFLFDIKKHGVFHGIRSGWCLRKLIDNAPIEKNSVLIYDKVGFREIFISAGYPFTALPQSTNIYNAYSKIFGDGERVINNRFDRRVVQTTGNIGIFPSSRVPLKCIPKSIVELVVKSLSSQGFNPVLFKLDGEMADTFNYACDVVKVPRNFSAMANAIKKVDAVISADSMPAHMAEYFGVPVFVITPEPNRYWLPVSAFNNNFWCCFNDIMAGDYSLTLFTRYLKNE